MSIDQGEQIQSEVEFQSHDVLGVWIRLTRAPMTVVTGLPNSEHNSASRPHRDEACHTRRTREQSRGSSQLASIRT
jgi:hypothetical protein